MNRIIPKPKEINYSDGFKTLGKDSVIYIDDRFAGIKDILTEEFPALSSCRFAEKPDDGADIRFLFNPSIKNEAYSVKAQPSELEIEASGYAGAFYAVQTLKQAVYFESKSGEVKLPCMKITDEPRFRHRGLSLDESRHFFGMNEVKRLLRLMAFYKLNVFHWHLTDDQGWRIEIKKYPLLTEIGSKRKDTNIHGWRSADMEGKPHEGFYTQDEIREIVAYADKLNITVIPEIDMPAHFAAAMAAYNHLGCREIPCEVHWFFAGYVPKQMGWEDWNRSCCAGKESTYSFIFDVIDEIAELFPAPYFHIGGDEAPKDEWKKCPECQKRMKENGLSDVEQLQGYFNNRIAEHLKSKGKRLIVWNEALAAGNLDRSVIGQYWTPQKDRNVLKHIKDGGEVIISKHQAFYYDMCYSQYPLTNTYKFEPSDKIIPEKYMDKVIGMEGEVWTEWIDSEEKLDVQIFPRALALSEICWTTDKAKNFKEFLLRMNYHEKILDDIGVNYAENEVSMPKGFMKRKKEIKAWYKCDQHIDVKKNRLLKQSKRK